MGHPHDRQPTAGIISLTSMEARKLTRDIGLLPANTRYRLVGKANPHLVEKGGQVKGAGQLNLSKVCNRMS